ncbi:uncharacterized protein LOC141718237 [Apium graveolens]|uniref:uncharacterized protein LOC141718237 n=1 Tax=Apium graveolens TaxID=4045 RepID=UPI003D7BB399
MLKKGFRWVLGDGTQINAFRDPWLRSKEGFCVENASSNNHRSETYLGYQLDMSVVEHAPTWLLQKLSSGGSEEIITIATGLLGIWNSRNMRMWDNKVLTPALAMEWSKKQVIVSTVNQAAVRTWIAPQEGEFKLNVDASITEGLSFFTVGMVIRNHAGQFVQGRNAKIAGDISVLEAEALGVLEVLSWLRTLPDMKVHVESDSLTVVNAILADMEYQVEVGHVIEACRSLLVELDNVSVRFVRRQANKVAHLMACIPCSLNCHNMFLSPPRSVLESIVSFLML